MGVIITLRPFYPWGESPGTLWIGGWLGSTDGLDAVGKKEIRCSCRESNPDYLAVQPVTKKINKLI
jgi:hypothetical protein